MKKIILLLVSCAFSFGSCGQITGVNAANAGQAADSAAVAAVEQPKAPEPVTAAQINLEKQLTYDQHTLADTYPYNNNTRQFQWDKVKERLAVLENMQDRPYRWAVLQNYKNLNKEAPLVKEFHRDEYNQVADEYGVERYQSVPLYTLNDTVTPLRYGRDGHPVRVLEEGVNFLKVETLNFDGQWYVPRRYVKVMGDSVVYRHAIFVDRTNQNISTVEKVGDNWLIRSMNPATTGLQEGNPPRIFPDTGEKAQNDIHLG